MSWNIWCLSFACLHLGLGASLDGAASQCLEEESSMLQKRKGQAIAKQFSVECVLEIFDADEVWDSAESCDLNFASCVNDENVYYIR